MEGEITLSPKTEPELADMVAGSEGGLRIQGGGTRAIGGTSADICLAMGGLSGISLYEPGALTMVAAAGTPLSEIHAALASEGQRLAFEPGDWRGVLGTNGAPTLGGLVAANASGPRRIQVGAARDFMLGVRFVDGAGRVVKNGGRVMKNVTGYDLVKLMCGSWGTLGVLTEASFKVLSVPETEMTLICEGHDAKTAIKLLCAALGTPFDVSGAAHFDAGVVGADSRTQVRIEGLDASVRYRAQRLRSDILAGFESVEGAESAKMWQDARDVAPFADREGAIWRVSVKPTDAASIAEALDAQGIENTAIYDWGGGLVWLLVRDQGDAAQQHIRSRVAALGGHAMLFRGSQQVRNSVQVFQPQNAHIAKIESGLRAKFDPRGILNPGLMS